MSLNINKIRKCKHYENDRILGYYNSSCYSKSWISVADRLEDMFIKLFRSSKNT